MIEIGDELPAPSKLEDIMADADYANASASRGFYSGYQTPHRKGQYYGARDVP